MIHAPTTIAAALKQSLDGFAAELQGLMGAIGPGGAG